MSDSSYDLVVIGAGPGGYVAAIRAAQLGLKTAVVERDELGGVCLNVGCIPSKALIHSASLFRAGRAALEAAGAGVDLSGFDYEKVWRLSRKAADRLSKGVGFLLKKNGVEVVKGSARLAGPRRVAVEGSGELEARAVILATGSRSKTVPGFEFDEKTVLSSTGVLMAKELPKSLLVLGAGAIGMEMAFVMSAFGVEVTVVELMERALPLEDAESAALVAKEFGRRGVKILTGRRATRLERGPDGAKLFLSAADGAETSVEAERILVAVGRSPNTEDLGLEALGVRLERGFVPVGDWQETQVSGVYAIGDIVATPLLAHVASKEGEIAAGRIAQLLKGASEPSERRVDPLLVPNAVYCEPELASFGLSEARAVEQGVAHAVARFPYRGIGKAVAIDDYEGQAKLVFDPASGAILGATVVGAQATELVHELLLASRSELRLEDIADTIHAHPTLSELVMETARSALGRAIHA